MNISGISSSSLIGYREEDNRGKTSAAPSETEIGANNSEGGLKISGMGLLYSRIFRTTDLSKEVYVETEVGTTKGLTTSRYDYLSEKDRDLLGSIYDYASKNNIDLKHVDVFVDELANFRKSGWVPSGDIFTVDGRRISGDFNPLDKVVAERIINSESFSSTKIDKDFLNRILDSSRPAHSVDFEFLEHLVSVFSADGNPKNSAEKFSIYDSTPKSWVTNISSSVDPTFIPEEPDLISINGGPYFKNPKKDVLSNADFLKSIDTDMVSKYFDAFLESTSQKSDSKKLATETNNWIGDLYQGVKKLVGG